MHFWIEALKDAFRSISPLILFTFSVSPREVFVLRTSFSYRSLNAPIRSSGSREGSSSGGCMNSSVPSVMVLHVA